MLADAGYHAVMAAAGRVQQVQSVSGLQAVVLGVGVADDDAVIRQGQGPPRSVIVQMDECPQILGILRDDVSSRLCYRV